MGNFKIIAIRTGKKKTKLPPSGSSTPILDPMRNLKENTIFPFRKEYEFPQNDFSEVKYLPEKDIPIYQINVSNNPIPVNISAVVGSNGSGKSTLIELLYWASYNIGAALGLLKDRSGNRKKPYMFLDIEILYSTNPGTLIKLSIAGGKLNIYQYRTIENIFKIKNTPPAILGDYSFFEFTELWEYFYTIAVNYSHYSLNSEEMGSWLHNLFHKNDGYQVPIVLNPWRTKGDIDINRENHLLSRRLIANLLEPVEKGKEANSLRNIANGKIASELELKLLPKDKKAFVPTEEDKNLLIMALQNPFSFSIDLKKWPKENTFEERCLLYIYNKLFKIAEHTGYRRFKDSKSKTPKIKYMNAFLGQIYKSKSHLVFKIKGAILYLKYHTSLLPSFDPKYPFRVPINELSDGIKFIENKEPEGFGINNFMMAPPSFFKTNIIPEKGIPFNSLSSGEKQKIHSISSIVYHLINLNSVEQLKEDNSNENESTEEVVHYNHVNIILDEIELYFHPEWQRTYISDLLAYIGKINSENLKQIKGLNFIFLTHSPYILSDIPDTYVLKLENGAPFNMEGESRTFGANIHDLLANDFFMKNGFMGEYARTQIDALIRELNSTENIAPEEFDNYKKRIEIIGEPFLQAKLFELLASKSGSDYIDTLITMRKLEIERLENLKKNKKDDQN